MRRYILLVLIPVFCIAGDRYNEELLSTLLEDLVETDAAGMQYLIDNFPYAKINLYSLGTEDLDELFFLTPKSREIIWQNRDRLDDLSDLEKLDILPAERQLLILCQRKSTQKFAMRYYGRYFELEELSKGEAENQWNGPRYGQWQKIIFQKGAWNAAFSLQKDPGERNFTDAMNGYVAYRNKYLCLAVGSFFPEFGLGLLYSPPRFNSFKQILNTPLQSRARGYYGSDENWAMHGVFAQAKLQNVTLHAGLGRQLFDGKEIEGIWSISIDGLHRDSAEIAKIHKIRVENIYFSGTYKASFFTAGTLFSLSHFYSPVQYQNQLWAKNFLQHSLFLKVPEYGIRAEIKTVPNAAINFYKWIKLGKTRVDVYAYYYDGHSSLNGRHFLYNRLPLHSRGINLRWKKRSDYKNDFFVSGYINYEDRFSEGKKYFIYGIDLNWGATWHRTLGIYVSQKSNIYEYMSDVNVTCRVWRNFGEKGKLSAKLHLGLKRNDGNRFSQYFLLRYKRELAGHLNLVFDLAAWQTDEGTQVWFYQDGLPQAFSIFTSSAKGTLWTMMVDYPFYAFHLYYRISKQNHWGEKGLGSGETAINGHYKTTHQLGIVFQI